MNQTDKPQSNQNIIIIVVVTLAVCAIEGVSILGFCLLWNKEVNVALLTAFVGLVNFSLGAVAGVLAKTYATNASARSDVPVEASLQIGPAGTDADPIKTEQVNTEENPAIVKEAGNP